MRPDCFADIDTVFPVGADGLRQSPPGCLACEVKVECLKTALNTPRGSQVDRGGQGRKTVAGKVLKGFRRWSALKSERLGGADKGSGE